MSELGRHIWLLAMSIGGSRTDAQWKQLLLDLTEFMGMTPVNDAAEWHYPLQGKGGNGMTLVQPITDSFLALDTWPDHNGVYLFINSCKPFDYLGVMAWVKSKGLELHDETYQVLGLR